jgi:regulation of enolase protein 1 (concanavalin A-like superfamily)
MMLDIESSEDLTISLDFSMEAVSQFDQAGLLVYLDDDHWLKCGIEYCDGQHRLSAVVCNVFSDWSTRPWPASAARLRLHMKRFCSSFCIEAALPGADTFEFFRIGHLSCRTQHADIPTVPPPPPDAAACRAGPYACAPTAQRGFSASFSAFACSAGRAALAHSDRLDA